jgi:subfamily B ATP-binding cassette protein HlyB/CyaB
MRDNTNAAVETVESITVSPVVEAAQAEPVASTLAALCVIARLHQIAADPAHLAHQLGRPASHRPSTSDLLLAAKRIGLKAKLTRTTADRLKRSPLPATPCSRPNPVAYTPSYSPKPTANVCSSRTRSGAIQGGRPVVEPMSVFESQWTGELILITSRASLAGELAKFDFSWFIPSLVKYRTLSASSRWTRAESWSKAHTTS